LRVDPDAPVIGNPTLGEKHFGDPGAYPGMTIRTWLAGQVLGAMMHLPAQGFECSGLDLDQEEKVNRDYETAMASRAVSLADTLIAELNKPVDKPAPAVPAPPATRPPEPPIPPGTKCTYCVQDATYRAADGLFFCGSCVPF
jgi:hypothetical protein